MKQECWGISRNVHLAILKTHIDNIQFRRLLVIFFVKFVLHYKGRIALTFRFSGTCVNEAGYYDKIYQEK